MCLLCLCEQLVRFEENSRNKLNQKHELIRMIKQNHIWKCFDLTDESEQTVSVTRNKSGVTQLVNKLFNWLVAARCTHRWKGKSGQYCTEVKGELMFLVELVSVGLNCNLQVLSAAHIDTVNTSTVKIENCKNKKSIQMNK